MKSKVQEEQDLLKELHAALDEKERKQREADAFNENQSSEIVGSEDRHADRSQNSLPPDELED